MKRVVIIGSGNLAEALARVVAQSKVKLVQVFSRNEERARAVAKIGSTKWTTDPDALADADLYLIAVSDKAVAQVAGMLPIPLGAVVAHTAGSVSIDQIPAKYARRAVFYPLQTFTCGREVDFSQIPVFIEASTPELLAQMEEFASKLTTTVLATNSDHRALVHLAAVFACNFTNHMYAISEGIVRGAGFDFEVLKPLLAETAAKAMDAASPVDVQTGPAVRNDFATRAVHGEMLASDLHLKNIYSTISQSIWEISKKI